MRRILITGAGGMLGHALVPVLAAANEVRLFDRALDPRNDLLDRCALTRALEGCAGIVHLAACSRVSAAERDPAAAQRDNVDATEALVRAASAAPNRPWIVFTSSREVYGRPEVLPVSEEAPIAPVNVYGRSKAQAESLIQLARELGSATSILRLTNVYGSVWDHPDRLVTSFVRRALARQTLSVRGKDRTVDLLHVSDAVRAIDLAVRHHLGGGSLPVMNIGWGREVAIGELATLVQRAAGSTVPVASAVADAHEVHRYAGAIRLAIHRLGWQPRTELAAGLARLVELSRLHPAYAVSK